MATVETKLMTAAEFYDWVNRPENQDRSFELERGGVVEMPPPSKFHGFVCGNVAGILRNYAAQRRKGYPCTNDAGVVV
jgi:Uma2 family endonuclease